jgi:hypothetical protein
MKPCSYWEFFWASLDFPLSTIATSYLVAPNIT